MNDSASVAILHEPDDYLVVPLRDGWSVAKPNGLTRIRIACPWDLDVAQEKASELTSGHVLPSVYSWVNC